MRNLTTGELAQTNGGFSMCGLYDTVFGGCPVGPHIVSSAIGAAVGATISHSFMKNAKIVQFALGGAALGVAMVMGGNFVMGNNSTAA